MLAIRSTAAATEVAASLPVLDSPETSFGMLDKTRIRHVVGEPNDPSAPTSVHADPIDLPEGSLHLGLYQLENQLVRGPLHAVYRARRIDTGETVAVKVLRRQTRNSSAPERLAREWQILQSLDHPHIVRPVDFGSETDALCLVMEYLHGPALDQYVRQYGPLPFTTAADFIRQAAEALSYAHSQGVVHRDVKPSNLLLTSSGAIKLIDFGISSTENASYSITLVHGDGLIGTADYMSPEQAQNAHAADERADIYALGCTLYFLLTGQAPYPSGSMVTRLLRHRNEPAPSPALHRPDVPMELANLCLAMMAKNPDDRIRSMDEVCGIVTAWLDAAGRVEATLVLSGDFADSCGDLRAARKLVHEQLTRVMRLLDEPQGCVRQTLAEAAAELRDQVALVFTLEQSAEFPTTLGDNCLTPIAERLILESERLYRSVIWLADALARPARRRVLASDRWVAQFCDFARQFHRHESRVEGLLEQGKQHVLGDEWQN